MIAQRRYHELLAAEMRAIAQYRNENSCENFGCFALAEELDEIRAELDELETVLS